MEWKDWINEKYLAWRGNTRRSVSEYVAYLNQGQPPERRISQPTVSAWINGTRNQPTSRRIVERLYEIYGVEVYDQLGLPRPEEMEQLAQFPPGVRSRMIRVVGSFRKEVASRGLDIESPEAEALFIKLMESVGDFKITKIESEETARSK